MTTNEDDNMASLVQDGDPLSDVLETIRLRGAVFFLWEPSWPYAMSVANGGKFASLVVPGSDQIISYHIVTEGPCWGAVHGEEPVRLETGDVLILPRGDAYVIASEPRSPMAEDEAASLEFFRMMAAGSIPPVVVDGGGGPGGNKLICGFLGCDMRPFNPLLGTLPRMIRIPAPEEDTDPLSSLIEFALTESRQGRGGERSLLRRLSELMFVEVLRRYLRSTPTDDSSWLVGLRDPVVGKALDLLHRRITERWTLEKLANEIGTSRSTLADRFSQSVGEPPMQYLTRWRMQAAARQLADSASKVQAVAQDVGYESEAAFSRAFKRVVGVTPKAWRDRAR